MPLRKIGVKWKFSGTQNTKGLEILRQMGNNKICRDFKPVPLCLKTGAELKVRLGK